MRRRLPLLAFAAIASALVATPARAQLPAVAYRAPLDDRQGVHFHALVGRDTVYVGQQAEYQVGVFLGEPVRGRLRRNPEFVPPEMPGMLSYDLPTAHGSVPRASGGRYEVHVFSRAVFPLTPGMHVIQPARLTYSLPLSSSFFSREESHTLRSSALRIVALEPPIVGRPADYDGAVASDLSVRAMVNVARGARVGDPMLLTVRIAGSGNVNLFPRPRLQLDWGDAVATGERVVLDSTSRRVNGSKEFDWLLTPREEGALVLPAIRYPYFDPERERYVVAQAAPETLSVASGAIADRSDDDDGTAMLALRHRFRGDLAPHPASSALYWFAVALLPVPALLVGWRRTPRVRRRGALTPAAVLAAIGGGGATPPEARKLRALYLRAIADRLRLADVRHTRAGALTRLLRRQGVSPRVAADAERLLDELDAAAYAPAAGTPPAESGAPPGTLASRVSGSYERVDEEAKKGRPPRRTLALLLSAGLALSFATYAYANSADAEASFTHGVRAYAADRPDEALKHFQATVRLAPRAADAWANLGTAAWALSDTAVAAYGWQRALRLEPLATDLRPRLSLVGPDQFAGHASVPPISASILQWLALAGWMLACAAAFQARRPRHPRARSTAGSTMLTAGAVAIALGATALWQDERLEASHLAVIASATQLRELPALTARTGPPLATAEVVKLGPRQGAWVRVTGRPGAEGWVQQSRLLLLQRH